MTFAGIERPSIYDVALVAGMSQQTVSRVLDGPETVHLVNR